MVAISQNTHEFIFKLKGLHFIWALKHELRIPKNNIVRAYQDADELNKFKGLRFGTHIPFLITAGTFYWKGKHNFWDMTNKKKTIIVELQNNYYSKLYIDVADPNEIIDLLNAK